MIKVIALILATATAACMCYRFPGEITNENQAKLIITGLNEYKCNLKPGDVRGGETKIWTTAFTPDTIFKLRNWSPNPAKTCMSNCRERMADGMTISTDRYATPEISCWCRNNYVKGSEDLDTRFMSCKFE